MSQVVLGLILALIASVAINSSFALQHAGSRREPAVSPRHPIRMLRSLVGSRLWLAGALLGTGGWALMIVALAHAPLSLVQAFVAGGLALALPIATAWLGYRPRRKELLAVGLMSAALIALSTGIGHEGPHGHYLALTIGVYLAAATALAGTVAASVRTPRWRAHALGLAGGALYGVADTAIKALTTVLSRHGVVGVLASPLLWATAIAAAAAFFCFTRGLQTGRALPVIGTMTAGTNLVSILGGFIVFSDPLGHSLALRVTHALALAVVIVAAALLAPTQTTLSVGEATEKSVAAGAAG